MLSILDSDNKIIEIGHFYMNQDEYDLSYLNSIEVKSMLSDIDYIPCLFIDDVHIDHSILDIARLKSEVEYIIKRKTYIVYESEMSNYTDILYNHVEVKNKKYNSDGTIKQQVLFNDKLYTVANISPNYKLTCLGYSMIWSLIRTRSNRVPTRTIINRKFKNIEDIVKFYVEKVEIIYY